jgi:hypothetical protein
MGMTMQHPRPWLLPLPQRIMVPSSAGYPEDANKTRLITTVRVTLKRTLTKSQNRHPLPISSRALHCSSSRPRKYLHLEHYLF